jgi:plastocyanin
VRRAAAIVVAIAAAAALPAMAVPAGAGEAPTSRLGVRGTEFSLVLTRAKLPPGPALVQFQNAGEDPHDLRLRRVGTTRETGTGEVGSGDVTSFSVGWLKRRSAYRLWCSLPNHSDWGMEATLRVGRRR